MADTTIGAYLVDKQGTDKVKIYPRTKMSLVEVDDASSIVDSIYPVGSIYMSVNSTNPSTLFGGTWSQLSGQFLIGCNSTYTAGSTGGAATHTITEAELPKHTHDISSMTVSTADAHSHAYGSLAATAASTSHTHTIGSHQHRWPAIDDGSAVATIVYTTTYSGTHTHGGYYRSDAASGSAKARFRTYNSSIDDIEESNSHFTQEGGNHTHDVAITPYYTTATTPSCTSTAHTHTITMSGSTATAGSHTHTASGTTDSTGSGTAMTIMPPYLAVYMWKRTA